MIEPFRRSFVPALVLCQIDRSELAPGPLLRALSTESLTDVVADQAVQMELELSVHSPFPTSSPEPRLPVHISDSLLCGFENQGDGLAQTLPARSFGVQLLAS